MNGNVCLMRYILLLSLQAAMCFPSGLKLKWSTLLLNRYLCITLLHTKLIKSASPTKGTRIQIKTWIICFMKPSRNMYLHLRQIIDCRLVIQLFAHNCVNFQPVVYMKYYWNKIEIIRSFQKHNNLTMIYFFRSYFDIRLPTGLMTVFPSGVKFKFPLP